MKSLNSFALFAVTAATFAAEYLKSPEHSIYYHEGDVTNGWKAHGKNMKKLKRVKRRMI